MSGPLFYLGTHQPSWLSRVDVPLFISARRLRERVALPRALGPWALDSGGFSEISLFGGWRTSPQQYAREVRRWRDEIGGMQWAATQDWMCEPVMLRKTGLSVAQHQRSTVTSYLELRHLAPDLPWIPVLQGWRPDDYLRHLDDYARAGVDLASLPVVGVGSVCRRQDTDTAEDLVGTLHRLGLRLHLFGFKAGGLVRCVRTAASADSMAWSFGARRKPPLPECRGKHRNCANCKIWALRWREKLLARLDEALERPGQRLLSW